MTPDRLREVLSYDPLTGQFHWKLRLSWRVQIGAVAGRTTEQGYIKIRVDGREYRTHRLAWLYMTGEWPADQVDHKNRNRADNSWENLRQATNAQNQANATSRPRSVCRGVDWIPDRNRFRARIKVGGRRLNLGSFHTEEEARKVYRAAARAAFGSFASS